MESVWGVMVDNLAEFVEYRRQKEAEGEHTRALWPMWPFESNNIAAYSAPVYHPSGPCLPHRPTAAESLARWPTGAPQDPGHGLGIALLLLAELLLA